MVEHHLAKVGVASSSLVFRSIEFTARADARVLLFPGSQAKLFSKKVKIGVDGG